MFHGMDGHGWGMGWGWIIGLILLAAVIWIIFKMANPNRSDSRREKSPLDVLKERYARGEIDKQEFEEKKKDLL